MKEDVASQAPRKNDDAYGFEKVGLVVKVLLVILFIGLGLYAVLAFGGLGGLFLFLFWGIAGCIASVRPVIGIGIVVLLFVVFFSALSALIGGGYSR